MKHIILNNFIFFTFGLFYYFIGIFIKYLNLNIFEAQLFITLLTIYGFLSSNLINMYDNIHPYHTLQNIYKLDKKEKFILLYNKSTIHDKILIIILIIVIQLHKLYFLL